jgi:hypothetical protein
MNVLILLQNTWLDYCQSRNLLCTPPNKNAEAELLVIICAIFGIWILLSAAYYAIVRLRIKTGKQFQEATSRLDANILLLSSSGGKSLHHVCRGISSDLIQVTGAMEKSTSRCFSQYYFSGKQIRMKSLMEFMRENKSLRTDAIIVRFICFLPFLVRPMAKGAREAADKYKGTWLPMSKKYTVENPDCRGYF